LAYVGIKCLLHFLLKLKLSFPEENLALAFHNFIHEVCLLFSDDVYIVFKFSSLMLHLFQFFNELAFQIDILILKFLLLIAIDSDVVIQLIHLLLEALEVDSYFIDFPLEVAVALIQSDLFLLHNRLLILEIYHTFVNLLELVVFVDEDCLLLDPFTVELIAFLLELLAFS
jgi:hypothetical protein